MSKFCPRATARQPGRRGGGGGSKGLTSKLLRGVVQVPCRRLHHTAVIHQPEGQGSSVSGRGEAHPQEALPQGSFLGHQEASRGISPSLSNPHHHILLLPGITNKRQSLLGWGWGAPGKAERHTQPTGAVLCGCHTLRIELLPQPQDFAAQTRKGRRRWRRKREKDRERQTQSQKDTQRRRDSESKGGRERRRDQK